jgi:hypothetical protein
VVDENGMVRGSEIIHLNPISARDGERPPATAELILVR